MDRKVKISLFAVLGVLIVAALAVFAAIYFPARSRARAYTDIEGASFFAGYPAGDRPAWFVHGPVSYVELDGKRTAFASDGRLEAPGDLVRLYDDEGRFDGFEIVGSDGRVMCTYDGNNLLLSKVEDFDFNKGTYQYEYDPDGNLVSEKVTLDEGDTLTVSLTRRFLILAVDACKNWTLRRGPDGAAESRTVGYEEDPELESSLVPRIDKVAYNLILDGDDPAAKGSLGGCYLSLYETFSAEEYLQKALPLLEKASGAGDPRSLYLLGRCSENGTGMPKDPEKAARLYEEAARQGHLAAAALTADRYFTSKNFAEALPFLEQAAEGGDALSSLRLAEIYRDGKGVTKDLAETLLNYRTAASDGSLTALCRLGTCYELGRGCEPDSLSAYRSYHTAAMFGLVDAQNHLGECYRKGIGVPVDRYLARIWYGRAAEAGSAAARTALDEMEEEDLDMERTDASDPDETDAPSVNYTEYFNF